MSRARQITIEAVSSEHSTLPVFDKDIDLTGTTPKREAISRC